MANINRGTYNPYNNKKKDDKSPLKDVLNRYNSVKGFNTNTSTNASKPSTTVTNPLVNLGSKYTGQVNLNPSIMDGNNNPTPNIEQVSGIQDFASMEDVMKNAYDTYMPSGGNVGSSSGNSFSYDSYNKDVNDFTGIAESQYSKTFNQMKTNLKDRVNSIITNLQNSKIGINANYDSAITSNSRNTQASVNAYDMNTQSRGLGRSSIATTGIAGIEATGARRASETQNARAGALSMVDNNITNANNQLATGMESLENSKMDTVKALAHQLFKEDKNEYREDKNFAYNVFSDTQNRSDKFALANMSAEKQKAMALINAKMQDAQNLRNDAKEEQSSIDAKNQFLMEQYLGYGGDPSGLNNTKTIGNYDDNKMLKLLGGDAPLAAKFASGFMPKTKQAKVDRDKFQDALNSGDNATVSKMYTKYKNDPEMLGVLFGKANEERKYNFGQNNQTNLENIMREMGLSK